MKYLLVESIILCSELLRLLASPSSLYIYPCQSFAGLNQLDDINNLLQRHEWKANLGYDTRQVSIHFVRSRHLKRRRAIRIGKDLG